jgi:hypothetical protein
MSTNSCLIIRTGLPGNGKTLNTIKEVDEQAFAQSRPVFYHNVSGLKPEKLRAQWFQFDDPLLWHELPNDSIIVIDEAQGDLENQRFGVRDPRKPVPLHVSKIETLRHKGHELNLITQDPRFLDVHARRLCNNHVHYWRAFGSSQIVRFTMPRVKDDVEKISGFKDCEKTIVKLDKRFFDVYDSAQASHHFKFKVPKALYILGLCLLLLGYIAYSLKDRFLPETPTEAPAAAAPSSGILPDFMTGSKDQPFTKAQYLANQKPRVADIPSSAPIYDDLTKPVAFPKTFCVMTYDETLIERNRYRMNVSVSEGKVAGCQCYTQQNTRVKTSFDFCADVVANGLFDPSKPDPENSKSMRDRGDAAPSFQPENHQAQNMPDLKSNSRVSVVADNEYASRPWR